MKIGDEIYVHGYVDEIRKDCIIVKNKGGYFGTVQEEISEVIPPIDLREMDLWIPVSKELPEERERVLICLDAPINQICVSQRVDTNYWIGQGRVNVLAWQPLPKPYEVKEE